jgi:iron complex transport system substrate-binding protein
VEAGGNNIFGDLDSPFPTVSEELLLVRNPAVILAPTSATTESKRLQILGRSSWSDIAAIANKDIHFIDEDIVSRPGPRVIDALEAMVSAIYPHLEFAADTQRDEKAQAEKVRVEKAPSGGSPE